MSIQTIKERCQDLLRLYLTSDSDETNSFNIEFLLDALTCLYYECSSVQHRNERNCMKFSKGGALCIRLLTFKVKNIVEKIESCRLSRSEFETIRLIGSGAFGEVSLVKWKASNEYFALKSLHKYDMLKRSDVSSAGSRNRSCSEPVSKKSGKFSSKEWSTGRRG